MALTEAQLQQLEDKLTETSDLWPTHQAGELVPLIEQWIDEAREMAPEGCSAETGLDHCPIKNPGA